MAGVESARVDELTQEQQDRVRRAWRRRLWLLGALVPLSVLGGALGVVLARRDRPVGTTHQSAPWWVIPLVVVVGLLMVGGSLVLARRQYTRPSRIRSLVATGDPKDLRRVAKLVRRGRPVPDEDRPLAQAYVDLLPRQVLAGVSLVALVGLELLLQALSPTRTSPVVVPALVVGGLGGLVVAVSSVVARRRAAAQGLVATPRRRRRS